VLQALQRALQALPEEDQLILRMRYLSGASVADIARALHIEQKPLYRRIENNRARLRAILEESGISRELVSEFLTEE
jgi:RNA polymerase sigma factor for flagellar operon FliA